jgi:hypothetical protein
MEPIEAFGQRDNGHLLSEEDPKNKWPIMFPKDKWIFWFLLWLLVYPFINFCVVSSANKCFFPSHSFLHLPKSYDLGFWAQMCQSEKILYLVGGGGETL